VSPLPPLGSFAFGGALGDYQSIATNIVGAGGASSVTFSSIASTFKHLQLRVTYAPWTTTNGDFKMRINSDSGSNYSRHGLYGNGASAVFYGLTNETYVGAGYGANGGYVSLVIIDVLDYANTNKYKTSRALAGYDTNGAGYVTLNSSLWMSTRLLRCSLAPYLGLRFYC